MNRVKTVLKNDLKFVHEDVPPVSFQEIKAKCFHCGQENRFALPPNLIDYKSLSDELNEQYKHLWKEYYSEKRINAELRKETIDFIENNLQYFTKAEKLIELIEKFK